jgi:hypothetical protein
LPMSTALPSTPVISPSLAPARPAAVEGTCPLMSEARSASRKRDEQLKPDAGKVVTAQNLSP